MESSTEIPVAHERHWYVVRVKIKCELRVARLLSAMGYETFVPTQTEVHQWSDRKKKVHRVLIPMLVFVHTDEGHAREIGLLSYVYELMKSPGTNCSAVIPDDQIDRFKFMLGHYDSELTIEPFDAQVGLPVIISRGPLQGLEGVIIQCNEGERVGIRIDYLGYASIQLPRSSLSPIQ